MTDPRSTARANEAAYRERHRQTYNRRKKLQMRARRRQERLQRMAEAIKS